jgi:hypothetical protein
MQYQPPHKNNPSNPLFKVAALNLEKNYVGLKPFAKAEIKASLNFKRSSDLRGVAKSSAGYEITVCFTLGIKRASLEINFSFEEGGRNGISVHEIAYAAPLEKKDKIVERASVDRQSKSSFRIGAGLAARLRLTELSGSAAINGKADTSASGGEKSNATVTGSYNKNNISVTFGGSIIHWEFNSGDRFTIPHQISRPSHLEGEVFYSAKQTGLINACVVSWPQSAENTLLVEGSVFTSMQDLDIEEVTFLTNDGEELTWRNVDQSELSSNDQGFNNLLETNLNKKKRFVRQIIRKHLIAQGMNAEGARVQICKAYT